MPLVDLDEPCGRYLTYRDLIACGKTWHEHAARGAPIDNMPRDPASLAALVALATSVLDPLIDEWGRPSLTYGFASPRLTAKIYSRIAPALDQHAAHELRRDGTPVCARGGAAVDLTVPGRPSAVVARWIANRLPFDRLYLYGDDRPLHVSFGPQHTRAVVALVVGPSGRLVPRRVPW